MNFNKVPERINDLQTCYFWYFGTEPDDELRSLIREDQMLVVGCPNSCPKLITDFNQAGGLVLLYISIYKAPIIEAVPDGWSTWQGGSPDRSSAQANPFWNAVQLGEHPDWILRNEQGQPSQPFEDPNYMPGWYQTTSLAKGYCEAVSIGIEAVASDRRFNGIMCDNFHPNSRHSTLLKNGEFQAADMKAHKKAFYSLARSIRQTGNNVANRYFWIVTNGGLVCDSTDQQISDAIIIESFIYSWAWPGSSMDDQQALDKLKSATMLSGRGGRLIALPYFGFSGNNIIADARRVRRLTDQAGAIFSDMFTLARPAMVSTFARRNWEKQSGQEGMQNPPALKALQNEVQGDCNVAKEVYRVSASRNIPGDQRTAKL
ncbi:MAG: hypothetical protein ABIG61_07115 [Planctomycetota bacterium]